MTQDKQAGKIGMMELIVIAYFIMCAGPYGIEEIVKACGPAISLITCAALPIFLALPLSMIFSEISSVFPQRGSTVMWGYTVLERMKAQKAPQSQQSIMTILVRLYTNTLAFKSIFTNAIIPALVCEYLQNLWQPIDKIYWRYVVGVLSFSLVTYLNMKGIDVVGVSQYIFTAFVLIPILIMTVLSFSFWDLKKISFQNQPKTKNFGLLLSNVVWQCTGFDQATNLAGEVRNPQKTYPRALLIVVFAVVIFFVLPIMAGVMVLPDHSQWENGTFAALSSKLPGCQSGWLRWWLIAAGGLASLSVLNSCVSCNAREIYKNAACGLLPFCGFVGKLIDLKQSIKDEYVKIDKYVEQENDQQDENNKQDDEHGLPVAGIFIVTVIPATLSFMSFEQLLSLGAFCIGTALVCELFFYVYMRHGRYGAYQNNFSTDGKFALKKSGIVTGLIITPPIGCAIVLWFCQGYKPLITWAILQGIVFVAWGVETLIHRKRSKID